MSHTWPLLIGLAITGLLSVPTMNAQEVVGPLPVKTVIRGGAEVSDFRLFPISPNGKYVAYTLSENEFGHRTKDLWANYCWGTISQRLALAAAAETRRAVRPESARLIVRPT